LVHRKGVTQDTSRGGTPQKQSCERSDGQSNQFTGKPVAQTGFLLFCHQLITLSQFRLRLFFTDGGILADSFLFEL
jgi:hypothetical protein